MAISYHLSKVIPFGVLVEPTGDSVSVVDLSVEKVRTLVRQYHLVVLRGFLTFDGAEAFADYCARWGEISIWPFGKVLELIEQENPTDHIFDHSYVPLHWDGMYREQVPEFQIFHCVSAPLGGQGGRTTFSNTTLALQNAADNVRSQWKDVTGIYRRKMEFYDSKTVAPIITAHPVSGLPVIRYNEPPQAGDDNFINHPDLAFTGVTDGELNIFHNRLREVLYAPENFYAHSWHPSDIVISDNYTLLHGREAFTSGAPRHLQRVHVLGQPALNNPHLVAHP